MAQVTLTGEVNELRRRFKAGYKLERTGGGHYRIRDSHGRLVTYQGKNITIGTNPSPGVVRSLEEQLRAAGVLKGTGMRVAPKVRQRQQEGLARATRERQGRHATEAARLTARLGAVLEVVGGLDRPGMPSDLGAIGVLIAREQGKQMTPDLLTSAAYRVTRGQYVETKYREVWDALAERLERAADAGGQWFSLVREARGLDPDRVEVTPVGDDEWPFRVELLSLTSLLADPAYQRPVSWPFVRATAAAFDPSLVGTIDVAQRSPSRYAILDGQQRTEVVRLVGLESIWASVYKGLDAASEARFFLRKNLNRKNVHPYYTFRARVAAHDVDAMALDRIVVDHGYVIAIGAPGQNDPESRVNNIAAISALEAAFKLNHANGKGDESTLPAVLRVLRASTLGRPLGQSAALIRGVSGVFATYGSVDEDRLASALDKLGPGLAIGRARDLTRSAGGQIGVAVEKVLVAEYNRHGDRTTRLAK